MKKSVRYTGIRFEISTAKGNLKKIEIIEIDYLKRIKWLPAMELRSEDLYRISKVMLDLERVHSYECRPAPSENSKHHLPVSVALALSAAARLSPLLQRQLILRKDLPDYDVHDQVSTLPDVIKVLTAARPNHFPLDAVQR